MGGEEKMPQVLKYGYVASKTIEHYASIKIFTDLAVEEPVLLEIYDKILSSLNKKIQEGFVCYMRSYSEEDKKFKEPYHNFYFSLERDVLNNFAEVMMQMSDVVEHDFIMKITFEKGAKKGQKAIKQEMRFYTYNDQFILTDIHNMR